MNCEKFAQQHTQEGGFVRAGMQSLSWLVSVWGHNSPEELLAEDRCRGITGQTMGTGQGTSHTRAL